MTFLLASQGKTDKAEEYLKRLPKGLDEQQSLITTANKGLIAYRQGRLEDWRRMYFEAIDGFKRLGFPLMVAQARAYLAREAALAKELDAEIILAEAKAVAKRYGNSDLAVILNRVEIGIGRKPADSHGKAAYEVQEKAPKNLSNISWSTPGMPAQFRIEALTDWLSPKAQPKRGKH